MNKLKRALLATSVAAIAATSFAGTGAAIYTEVDTVHLGSQTAGVRLTNGTVLWDETGEGAQPNLSGTLHLENMAGMCARVRMISYSNNGNERGDRQFGPSDDQAFCAGSNSHVTRDVSLVGYPGTHEVKLTLQTLPNGGGQTKNIGRSEIAEYGPALPPSEVRIDAAEIVLGGRTPLEPAQLTWDVSTGFNIDTQLKGTLFVEDHENQKLRVLTTCYDATGRPLVAGTDGDLQFQEIVPETDSPLAIPIERNPCLGSEVVEVGVTIEVYNLSQAAFVAEHPEVRAPLPSVIPPIG